MFRVRSIINPFHLKAGERDQSFETLAVLGASPLSYLLLGNLLNMILKQGPLVVPYLTIPLNLPLLYCS